MQNLTTGDGDALPPAMGGLLPLKREEQRSHNQDLAASGALGEFAPQNAGTGKTGPCEANFGNENVFVPSHLRIEAMKGLQ